MKIETSKSVLKVCGSIDMFYGVLEILLGGHGVKPVAQRLRPAVYRKVFGAG